MKTFWKGHKRMTETPTGSIDPPEERPDSREEAARAVSRNMVVAEAKLLVLKMDQYLALMDKWEQEEKDARE